MIVDVSAKEFLCSEKSIMVADYPQNFSKQGEETLNVLGSSTFERKQGLSKGLFVSSEAALQSASLLVFENGGLKIVGYAVFPSGLDVTGVDSPTTFAIVVAESKNVSFAGIFSDGAGGVGSLSKAGLGTLSLTGANTFTGSTILLDGTLSISSEAALQSASQLIFEDGVLKIVGDVAFPATVLQELVLRLHSQSWLMKVKMLRLLGFFRWIRGIGCLQNLAWALSRCRVPTRTQVRQPSSILILQQMWQWCRLWSAGNIVFSNGSGTLKYGSNLLNFPDFSGRFTDSGGQIFRVDVPLGLDVVYSSPLMGGGNSLVKEGEGTLVLAGANSFTGELSIVAGVLAVEGGGSIDDSVAVFNQGVYEVRATDTIQSLNGSGDVVINASTALATGSDGDDAISEYSGEGSLLKKGSGSLTLSGDSASYQGDTNVSEGKVRLIQS